MTVLPCPVLLPLALLLPLAAVLPQAVSGLRNQGFRIVQRASLDIASFQQAEVSSIDDCSLLCLDHLGGCDCYGYQAGSGVCSLVTTPDNVTALALVTSGQHVVALPSGAWQDLGVEPTTTTTESAPTTHQPPSIGRLSTTTGDLITKVTSQVPEKTKVHSTAVPSTENPLTTALPSTKVFMTTVLPSTKVPITTALPSTEVPITTALPSTEVPITTALPSTEVPITTALPSTEVPITTALPSTKVPITTALPSTKVPITTALPSSKVPITTTLPIATTQRTTESHLTTEVTTEGAITTSITTIDTPTTRVLVTTKVPTTVIPTTEEPTTLPPEEVTTEGTTVRFRVPTTPDPPSTAAPYWLVTGSKIDCAFQTTADLSGSSYVDVSQGLCCYDASKSKCSTTAFPCCSADDCGSTPCSCTVSKTCSCKASSATEASCKT